MAIKDKESKRGGKLASAPVVRKRKPTKHTAMIPIRITPDLLDRIDAIKPDYVAREPYVRHLLDIGIRTVESEERGRAA